MIRKPRSEEHNMVEQPAFEFEQPVLTPITRLEEMRAQFEAFDKDHPGVWVLFERFTFDRISRGFENFGSKAVMERIRWETAEAQTPEDQFKISNNFTPFYARKFHTRHPEHDGFFRTHIQPSAAKAATGLSSRINFGQS
jgi:hypothetical protein